MFVDNMTYDRVIIIKSHLSTLSEFCEHCLGMRKFNRNRNNQPKGNKWFKYKNIVQYVDKESYKKKVEDFASKVKGIIVTYLFSKPDAALEFFEGATSRNLDTNSLIIHQGKQFIKRK